MAHTNPHTSSTSRPQLGQLRDMDARSASFGNRVRSEGEFLGILYTSYMLLVWLKEIAYQHDVHTRHHGLGMVFATLRRLY